MYQTEIFTIQPEPDSGWIVESAILPEPNFTRCQIVTWGPWDTLTVELSN